MGGLAAFREGRAGDPWRCVPGSPRVALVERPRTSFGSPLLHRPRPGKAHTPICTKIRKCVANEKGGQARVGEGSYLGSPNQISRTGQARQRIRRDKGNV